MLVSDIDNTLNALNALIYRAFPFPPHVYPAPLPPGFWSTPEGMKMLWDAPPLAGAAKLLRRLSRGGLAYVTCRPRETEDLTHAWLRRWGFPDAPVFFCKDPVEKAAVAARLGAALALEDDPAAVEAYSRVGVAVVVVSWPYNRNLRLAVNLGNTRPNVWSSYDARHK